MGEGVFCGTEIDRNTEEQIQERMVHSRHAGSDLCEDAHIGLENSGTHMSMS